METAIPLLFMTLCNLLSNWDNALKLLSLKLQLPLHVNLFSTSHFFIKTLNCSPLVRLLSILLLISTLTKYLERAEGEEVVQLRKVQRHLKCRSGISDHMWHGHGTKLIGLDEKQSLPKHFINVSVLFLDPKLPWTTTSKISLQKAGVPRCHGEVTF